MTHFEFEIDRIVLDGVPREWALGFGPLVEAALVETALSEAGTAALPPAATAPVSGPAALATFVAGRVLADARSVVPEIGKGGTP